MLIYFDACCLKNTWIHILSYILISQAYSITSDQKTIFYDLPPHVYQDIVARQRSKYILGIPFMKVNIWYMYIKT